MMTNHSAEHQSSTERAPHRRVLHSETKPMKVAAGEVDLDALRRALAELFELAARAVQVAGFEQDDAVIERLLVCRVQGEREYTIRAEALSDETRFLRCVEQQIHAQAKRVVCSSEITIVGLGVVATLEHWP